MKKGSSNDNNKNCHKALTIEPARSNTIPFTDRHIAYDHDNNNDDNDKLIIKVMKMNGCDLSE